MESEDFLEQTDYSCNLGKFPVVASQGKHPVRSDVVGIARFILDFALAARVKIGD